MSGGTRDALNRREFVAAAGAVICAGALPASAAPAVARTLESVCKIGGLEDWTIDDMWGVYPRYSEAIGYGRPRQSEALPAIAAVDANFTD